MVEFALAVVLLMALLFGVMDFGRAMYTYHFLSNAARDATRYAAVRSSTCDVDGSCSVADPDSGPAGSGNSVIQDYVTSKVPPGIDPSKVITNPSWPGNGTTACPSGSNNAGCPVLVTVTYDFKFLVPLVHSGSMTLSSSSETIISH